MDILSIISGLLLTAVSYMAFPMIRLLINGGRFTKNRAHKIALWNSVVLGGFFCITTIAVSEGGTIWNGAPAVLYYWINCSILADKNTSEETTSKEQIRKAQNRKNAAVKILKGIGALLLGIVSSDMLLLIILGDSIEGTTALILMFLVTILFFTLYFWLFTRRDKKKVEESCKSIFEEASPHHTVSAHISRPPQISYANEKKKAYGNYHVSDSEITLQSSANSENISFCRKCGTKLLDNSQFCHKCGTKSVINLPKKEESVKTQQLTPIDKLIMLTVGLPAVFADKSEEEINIIKNRYAYCETIIFVEFFVRANALELAPSKDIAMKFSKAYVEAIIKETTNTVPDTKPFFVDMFYERANLYDNIVMNSKEPIMDIVEVLTHIIHKELDDDTYVTVENKDFRYFGGIFENLTIKTELISLFQSINDCTADIMKELKEYLKTLE